MSQNYATPLPTDQKGNQMGDFSPAKVSNARYGNSAAVSSVITLNDNTTVIEVMCLSGSGGGGLALKWITAADTQASVIATGASANFDNMIAPNWRHRFVVPIEKQGVTSVVGLNKQNGLYNRVAVITAGTPAASVLLAEF